MAKFENTLEPELKEKWVKALRSGEYKQGCQFLYNPVQDTYCCLGVLACLAGIDRRKLENVLILDHVSQDLAEKFGPNRQTPVLLEKMNDGSRQGPPRSFEQIAAFIEENL